MTAAQSASPTTPAIQTTSTGPHALGPIATRAGAPRSAARDATRAVSRSATAVGALVLGFGGVFPMPAAASAAPAPCESAESYAAQSGSSLMRLDKLDLRPVGIDGKPTTDVGLGEAKSALIANAAVNAAAVARMLDTEDGGALSVPVVQSAPPNRKQAVRHKTTRSEIGPFALGSGSLTSRARWDPGMACGTKTGKVTRAEVGLAGLGIGGALVRVPDKLTSLSTTELEPGARAEATAGLAGGGFDLLDGAVHVKIVRPPSLSASMSTKDGSEVRYLPAVLEVSGAGIETTRLDTPGDDVELALGEEAEKADTDSKTESSTLSDLLSGLPKLDSLTKGMPLPVPTAPGLPTVGDDTESAQVTGPGTRLHIALGDVRQAHSGHSVGARATAIKIAITQGKTKHGYAQSAPNRTGVILDLNIGLLEAAAVTPEPRGGQVAAQAPGGGGGGLPITGPRVDLVALAGAALLVGGLLAMVFGFRRGRFRA